MADNTLRFRAILDDKVSSGLDRMRDKFDTLGKSKGFMAVAQGVGIGAGISAVNMLGSAIGSVSNYIGDAIGDASDMNETLSKSEVVFGANADAAEIFGDKAARGLGLSKQEAIEAEATFGNLFKTIGLGDQPTLDMSQGIVKLSSDLASFNNLDPTEVLEKLRSGLSGEAEPLRSLGVFLTEDKVKAKAFEMGLADTHGELSEGAKVQARYALIMAQTTTAQGDFGRTSDGLANTSRILNAELSDVSAEVGEELLPIMVDFAHFLVDDAVPALRQLKEGLVGAGSESQVTKTHMKSFAEATGDEFQWLGDQIGGIADFFTPWDGMWNYGAKVVERNDHRMLDSVEALRGGIDWASMEVKKDLTSVGTTSSKTAEKTVDALDKVVDEAHSAEKALHGLAQSAIDDYYGPIIARDKLLANQAEIAAAKRVLASKTATAAEKRDARSTLHQLEADNLELRVGLASAGKLSHAEQASLLADLKAKYKSATGAAKIEIGKLIEKIKSIPTSKTVTINVNTKHNGGGGKGGPLAFAAGGHYEAGVPRIVGEDGPEIDIPDHSGTIIPNGDADGMSATPLRGGGTTIIFNYAPQTSTASPTEAQRFARNVIPELVREMRRQRVLPAA